MQEQNLNYNTIKIVSNTRSVKYKTKITSNPWSTHYVRSRYTLLFTIIFECILHSSRILSSDFVERTLLISWHRVSRRGSDQSGWTQFPVRCNALIQCRSGRVVPGSRHNSRRCPCPAGAHGSEIRTCACTAARGIITAAAATVSECVFASQSRGRQHPIFANKQDLINFIWTCCSMRSDKYLLAVSLTFRREPLFHSRIPGMKRTSIFNLDYSMIVRGHIQLQTVLFTVVTLSGFFY